MGASSTVGIKTKSDSDKISLVLPEGYLWFLCSESSSHQNVCGCSGPGFEENYCCLLICHNHFDIMRRSRMKT